MHFDAAAERERIQQRLREHVRAFRGAGRGGDLGRYRQLGVRRS